MRDLGMALADTLERKVSQNRVPGRGQATDPLDSAIAGRRLRAAEVFDTYWRFAARRQGG